MLLLVLALTVLQLSRISSNSIAPNPTTTKSYTLSGNSKDLWNASALFSKYSGCLPDYRQLDCYPVYPLPNGHLSGQSPITMLSATIKSVIGIDVSDPKEYCSGTFEYAACLIDVACSHCNYSVVVEVERFCMAAFRADGDARFCKHYLQMNDLLGRCTERALRGLLLAEVIAAALVITVLNCVICACFCCLTCREDGYEVEDEEQEQQAVVNKNVIIDEEEE